MSKTKESIKVLDKLNLSIFITSLAASRNQKWLKVTQKMYHDLSNNTHETLHLRILGGIKLNFRKMFKRSEIGVTKYSKTWF